MKKLSGIPKRFKLFANTISVVWDNKLMELKGNLGNYIHGKRIITLSNTSDGVVLSNDSMTDTFYHEVVHAILHEMDREDLSLDDKFVDLLSKLIRQFVETQEY